MVWITNPTQRMWYAVGRKSFGENSHPRKTSSMTNTTEMANELARLGAVLEDCGISPISTVPFVQTSACVVG